MSYRYSFSAMSCQTCSKMFLLVKGLDSDNGFFLWQDENILAEFAVGPIGFLVGIDPKLIAITVLRCMVCYLVFGCLLNIR